jgi:hypothetical protein
MADKDKGYNFQGADIESFARYLGETSKSQGWMKYSPIRKQVLDRIFCHFAGSALTKTGSDF